MISLSLLKSLEIQGLHVGCRHQLIPGWLNVDLVAPKAGAWTEIETTGLRRLEGGAYFLLHDVTQPFPLEAGAFQKIYSEHLLEHLPLRQGVLWLTEMFRLLGAGGLFRLSTPDLKKYVEGYLDPESRFYKAHRESLLEEHFPVPTRKAWMMNQIFSLWEHRWVYDFEELTYAASQAGFPAKNIQRREYGVGALAEMDRAFHQNESLYAELSR